MKNIIRKIKKKKLLINKIKKNMHLSSEIYFINSFDFYSFNFKI